MMDDIKNAYDGVMVNVVDRRSLLWNRLEGTKIRQVIRAMVKEEDLLDYSVGVSGSCCIAWKIHEEPRRFTERVHAFSPGDVDVFVCRKHCTNEAKEDKFIPFLFTVLNRLKRAGYQARDLEIHSNKYIYVLKEVDIASFNVDGIETRFSFIECDEENNVQSVVRRFDFEVAQGVYDFARSCVVMEKNVVTNLKRGALQLTQEIKDMIVSMENDDICITPFHVWRLKSTRNRIKKYERRGFIFDRQNWERRLESLIEREEEREEERKEEEEYERLLASGEEG